MKQATFYTNLCNRQLFIQIYAIGNFVYQFMQPATLYTSLCKQQLCIPIYATCTFYTNLCTPLVRSPFLCGSTFLYQTMQLSELCLPIPTYVSLKLIQTYTFLYRCNHIHSYAYGHLCAVMHACIYTLLCKRSFLYVVMLPYFMRVYTKLCVRLSYTILCIRLYASFLKRHLCTVILPYAKNHLLKNYP